MWRPVTTKRCATPPATKLNSSRRYVGLSGWVSQLGRSFGRVITVRSTLADRDFGAIVVAQRHCFRHRANAARERPSTHDPSGLGAASLAADGADAIDEGRARVETGSPREPRRSQA